MYNPIVAFGREYHYDGGIVYDTPTPQKTRGKHSEANKPSYVFSSSSRYLPRPELFAHSAATEDYPREFNIPSRT